MNSRPAQSADSELPATIDWPAARVVVTGGAGFLGRAIVRALQDRGARQIVVPRSATHDLTRPDACESLLASAQPTVIIHAAAYSGGLGANRAEPARFFYDNMAMGLHLIEAARQTGAIERGVRLLVVGTMCSYPADAPLPYAETSLFGGLPDAEIASYGVAKLAILQMMRAYRARHGLRGVYCPLVNLYGPGDNIDDPARSHVAGALIGRFVDAAERDLPEVVCWGTGSPTRDFIEVSDAAEGLLRAVERVEDCRAVNIAGGKEVSIRELAELIARLTGYRGRLSWDAGKGDGVSRRCLDVSLARDLLGFAPRVDLETGLAGTIEWYRSTRRAR